MESDDDDYESTANNSGNEEEMEESMVYGKTYTSIIIDTNKENFIKPKESIKLFLKAAHYLIDNIMTSNIKLEHHNLSLYIGKTLMIGYDCTSAESHKLSKSLVTKDVDEIYNEFGSTTLNFVEVLNTVTKYNAKNCKLEDKKIIYYLTNCDEPLTMDGNDRLVAINEASKFKSLNVNFNVITINEEFHGSRFYDEFLKVAGTGEVLLADKEEDILQQMFDFHRYQSARRMRLKFHLFRTAEEKYSMDMFKVTIVQKARILANAIATKETFDEVIKINREEGQESGEKKDVTGDNDDASDIVIDEDSIVSSADEEISNAEENETSLDKGGLSSIDDEEVINSNDDELDLITGKENPRPRKKSKPSITDGNEVEEGEYPTGLTLLGPSERVSYDAQSLAYVYFLHRNDAIPKDRQLFNSLWLYAFRKSLHYICHHRRNYNRHTSVTVELTPVLYKKKVPVFRVITIPHLNNVSRLNFKDQPYGKVENEEVVEESTQRKETKKHLDDLFGKLIDRMTTKLDLNRFYDKSYRRRVATIKARLLDEPEKELDPIDDRYAFPIKSVINALERTHYDESMECSFSKENKEEESDEDNAKKSRI